MDLLVLLCQGSLSPAPAAGASSEMRAHGRQCWLPWTLPECL